MTFRELIAKLQEHPERLDDEAIFINCEDKYYSPKSVIVLAPDGRYYRWRDTMVMSEFAPEAAEQHEFI